MRRDYFTLDVRGVDWVETGGEPATPTVDIDFEGPAEELEGRLTDFEGELLDASRTDAAFRLHSGITDEDTPGVVSLTNRVTGDFILELNEQTGNVLRFIKAARAYGKEANTDEGRYSIVIRIDGDPIVAYDKSTFLIYDSDGNLLRQHSLIPSGVEL